MKVAFPPRTSAALEDEGVSGRRKRELGVEAVFLGKPVRLRHKSYCRVLRGKATPLLARLQGGKRWPRPTLAVVATPPGVPPWHAHLGPYSEEQAEQVTKVVVLE